MTAAAGLLLSSSARSSRYWSTAAAAARQAGSVNFGPTVRRSNRLGLRKRKSWLVAGQDVDRSHTRYCGSWLAVQFLPQQIALLLSLTLLLHAQPFNGRWSGTTQVGRYQKKHSPTHTHPNHQTSFINFLYLLRSIASSFFSLRALWQPLSRLT